MLSVLALPLAGRLFGGGRLAVQQVLHHVEQFRIVCVTFQWVRLHHAKVADGVSSFPGFCPGGSLLPGCRLPGLNAHVGNDPLVDKHVIGFAQDDIKLFEDDVVKTSVDQQVVFSRQVNGKEGLLEGFGNLQWVQGVVRFVDANAVQDGFQAGVETDEARQMFIPGGSHHAFNGKDGVEFFVLDQG